MKKIITVVLASLLLFSCEEPGKYTQDGFNASVLTENAILRYTGVFQPTSGISVSGNVKLYSDNGLWKLQLENFSISEGPDLKVYLSKTSAPNDFINVGNLTSSTIYNVPAQIDFNQYKYVLIHCQQFDHLFAIATLTQI
jgi:hypothetical protein